MCIIVDTLTVILGIFLPEYLAFNVSYIIVVCGFVILGLYALRFIYRHLFCGQRNINAGYREEWFGREPKSSAVKDFSVRPFKIEVPDEVLLDLKERLERTRYEDPVVDSRFQYGFNPNMLKKVVEYWKNDYDWRKQERMLNQFPQFKTRIEGIDVHFLHVKPNLPEHSKLKVLPLMLIHGWPGSIVEFYKLIPLLTTPRPNQNFVFEVICPSIPGFGFSESPHRKGLNARAVARMFVTLMATLDHLEFYVQGGDWGSAIGQLMAKYYSPKILGLHVNMYIYSLRPWEAIKFLAIAMCPFLVRKDEYDTCFPISKLVKFMIEEGGYFHLQGTKPDTLGCAMSDSPAGVAAYLLERFPSGADPRSVNLEDGGLTDNFTLDELLTNVMLYWVNNNFAAAARFYKENLPDLLRRTHDSIPVTAPCGIAVFPNEILMCPKTCMSQQMPNIVSYNIMPRGGHFAPLEEPELLANDVWQFVKLVRERN